MVLSTGDEEFSLPEALSRSCVAEDCSIRTVCDRQDFFLIAFGLWYVCLLIIGKRYSTVPYSGLCGGPVSAQRELYSS